MPETNAVNSAPEPIDLAQSDIHRRGGFQHKIAGATAALGVFLAGASMPGCEREGAAARDGDSSVVAVSGDIDDGSGKDTKINQQESPGDSKQSSEVLKTGLASPSIGYNWVIEPTQSSELGVDWQDAVLIRVLFNPDQEEPLTLKRVEEEVHVTLKGERGDNHFELVSVSDSQQITIKGPRFSDSSSVGFFVPREIRDNPSSDQMVLGLQVAGLSDLREASEAAISEAADLELSVLPMGERGQPYEFSLKEFDGGTLNRAEFEGKVVVFVDWATWCLPCKAIMSDLETLISEHPDSLAVIAINHDDENSVDDAIEAIGSKYAPFRHALVSDQVGERKKLFAQARTGRNSHGIPLVSVLGPDGILLHSNLVGPSAAQVRAQVLGLLE